MKRFLLAFLLFSPVHAAPPALNFSIVDQDCMQWTLTAATLSCKSTTPIPPDPPVINCGVATIVMPLTVPPIRGGTQPVKLFTQNFNAGMALVIPFTAPSPLGLIQTTVTDVAGHSPQRQYWLSTLPCGQGTVLDTGTASYISFKMGVGARIPLTPGQAYYITVRNISAQPVDQDVVSSTTHL